MANIPRIDLTKHTMEDGKIVDVTERICPGNNGFQWDLFTR